MSDSSGQTVIECRTCSHFEICQLRRNFWMQMGAFNIGFGVPYTEKSYDAVRWFDQFAKFCSFYDSSSTTKTEEST